MDDAGYVKFLAVLEHNRVFTTEDTLVTYPAIDEVLECAVYADNYSLDPGIRPQDVGSYGFVTAAEEQKLEPERTVAPQSTDFEMEMGCT